jgi:hypothetical protein
MKSRIHNFESYLKMNEASVESIANDFPQEWKRLEELGFYDATTPIVAKNGNIILKNRRFDYYPEGIVLQPASGYVRDRGVRSGFLKNGLDLKGMLDYLINRYSKYEGEQGKTGLSERVYGILKKYASNFKLNPKTGRIDSPVKIQIPSPAARKLMEEGVKFGKVKEFSLTGYVPYNQIAPASEYGLSMSIDEAKEFLPTDVKEEFKLWDVSIGGESFRITLKGKWNTEGKLDLIANGTPEEKMLVSMVFNAPSEEIQTMIDSDPSKMAILLKPIWKDLKKIPGYEGLNFPESHSQEADLVADLTGIGL